MNGFVYVDTLTSCLAYRRKWKYNKSCHMFVATWQLETLHEFAERIGLKRAWFQDHPRLPHYDLTESKRKEAIAAGAIYVDRYVLAAVMCYNTKRLMDAAEDAKESDDA